MGMGSLRRSAGTFLLLSGWVMFRGYRANINTNTPKKIVEAPRYVQSNYSSCWQDEASFLHNCNTSSPSGKIEVFSFFPRQCSVQLAYDSIKSTQSVEMGRQYLPPMDFSACDSPRDELDSVLATIFSPPNTNEFVWSHNNLQTIGKKIDWFAQDAMLKYIQGNESVSMGPPKPWTHKPSQTHWARHLRCADHVTSWDCMFGNASATDANTLDLSDRRVEVARKIWDFRPCISFNQHESCGAVSPVHLKKLLLGWTFRYTLPLNACEAKLRFDCQRNVVSIRNLDASKITNRVFLSVHMRMGDACDREETVERFEPFSWGPRLKSRPCILPVGYEHAIGRVTELYGVTDILLASDSEAAFTWAKNLTTHDIHYLDADRSKLDTHDKGWIEQRNDIGHVEVDSSIQEWNFLGNGQILIGGSCGKFTKTVYNIMVGRQNAVLPWVSVDGCRCFHQNPGIRQDVEAHCK